MNDAASFPHRRVPARPYLLLMVALATTPACVDRSSPVEVSEVREAPHDGGRATVSAALIGIEDALARIIPALQDPLAAEPLRTTLLELRAVLAAGGGAAVQPREAAARRALATYSRTSDGEDAEIDAVRLAMDAAAGGYPSQGAAR